MSRKKKKKYTYNGERGFVSYFARKYGYKPSTVWNRMNKGMTLEQALTTPKHPCSNGIKLEYEGEAHTYSEWGHITGIDEATIRSRIKRGWTVDEALGYEEHVSNYQLGGESLCWRCKRTALNCEWVRSLRPVEGWDVKEIDKDGERRSIVRECPKFIGGKM